MTIERFNDVTAARVTRCLEVLAEKGKIYSNGEDRLEYFRKAAAVIDTVPQIALWGMMAKHLTSLNMMVHNSVLNINRWDESITDVINYLLLLWALIVEEASVNDE